VRADADGHAAHTKIPTAIRLLRCCHTLFLRQPAQQDKVWWWPNQSNYLKGSGIPKQTHKHVLLHEGVCQQHV